MSLNLGPKDGNFQKYTEQLSSQNNSNQPPQPDPFASTLNQGFAQPQAQAQPQNQAQAQANPQFQQAQQAQPAQSAQGQPQAQPTPSWKAAHSARLLRRKLQVETANPAEQELVAKINIKHSLFVYLGTWILTWLVFAGAMSQGSLDSLLNPIYFGALGLISLVISFLVVKVDARTIQKQARKQALEQYRQQQQQTLS